MAHDVGFAVGHLGAAAQPLAGALRGRLAEVELDEGAYDRASPLLAGLTGLRAGEATPEVLRVLRGAPDYRGEWLRTAALRALGSFGPAAREAVPELRALIRRPGTASATEAAEALWAISGDADAVLPVLIEGLQSHHVHDRRAAAVALGALGTRAAVVAPRLRGLLAHEELWLRVDAAIALWEVSGRSQETVEALLMRLGSEPSCAGPGGRMRSTDGAGPGGVGRSTRPAERARLRTPSQRDGRRVRQS